MKENKEISSSYSGEEKIHPYDKYEKIICFNEGIRRDNVKLIYEKLKAFEEKEKK